MDAVETNHYKRIFGKPGNLKSFKQIEAGKLEYTECVEVKMKSVKRKTCKAVSAASHEDCGVWLDVAELRAKKQRTLARPISKLLNPLARSGGYSVAVALNFTQTKMEMPVTKQSTISSFFLPQNKKGRDAEDRSAPWPSGMSSIPLPEAYTGSKRKREIFNLPSEPDDVSGHSCLTDIESVSGCHDKEQQFLHLIWGYQAEECEPAGKKRSVENNKENLTDPQKASSKGIMCGCTTTDRPEEILETVLHWDRTEQHSQENIQMQRSVFGEDGDSSASQVFKDEHVTEKNASFLTPRSITEIQNTKKCIMSSKEPELFKRQRSSVKREDKETSRPMSQRHSTTLTAFQQQVCSSPAKHSSGFYRKLHWTPKKSTRETQENDDSFGTLFTQDSEGFQVIAHRTKRSICPLKDQTNSHKSKVCLSIPSVRSLDTDQEPEMLFTQDSQGNVVIKH